MLANIVSHNRKHDSTTTLKFGESTLTQNVQLDLVDTEDATLLSDVTVYDYISRIRTPFLMGYPAITSPRNGDLVTNATVFELTPYQPNTNFTGTVDSVEWQVASDREFTNIVYKIRAREQDVPGGDFSKFRPSSIYVGSGYYYVRARYISYPHASPFTQPVKVNFPSFKVEVPRLTMEANELQPTFDSTPYKLAPEFIGTEADDPLDYVTWTLKKIPDGKTVDSEYVNGLLEQDYIPDAKVVKQASDANKYKLTFPITDTTTNQEVKLTANTNYLVTVEYRGNRYATAKGKIVFQTGNYKVKPPKFKLVSGNDGVVTVNVESIETYEGSDTLKNFRIVVINQTDSPQHVVHTAEVTDYTYRIPDNVLEPSTKYSVSVIANGNKFGPSDTSVLTISMPYIGIEPPILTVTTRGMEPTGRLSPFRTIKSNDTMRGTQWLLYNHANTGVDNLIQEWTKEDSDTFLVIERRYLEVNTNYKLRARYLGHKYNSPWVEEAFKTLNIVVRQPVVTLSNLGLVITADVSDYQVVGDSDLATHVVWNVYEVEVIPSSDPLLPATETVVNHIVQNKQLPWSKKTLKLTRDDGIKRNTRYKVTAKILGQSYNSPVSEAAYINTPNVFVKIPIVHISGEFENVPRFPAITGTAFATNLDTDTHKKTTWKIEAVNTGDIVYNEDSTTDLTYLALTDNVLTTNTEYKLTVIYHGENFGASDPAVVNFKTRTRFIEMPDDGLPTVLLGDDSSNDTTKYYGTYGLTDLNGTRNYLGDWNGYTEYGVDSQVLYENRLWRALDTSSYASLGNNVHLNKNRVPGRTNDNNIVYWEEDDRNNLPTYKWLLKNIGFLPGITDNNKTRLTTDSITKGTLATGDSLLTKFMVKSKILYVYTNPELTNISYNDLALAGLTGQGRTIRIGERLYWLRLLTIEEIAELQRFKQVVDTTNIVNIDVDEPCWLADNGNATDGVYNSGSQTHGFERGNKRNKGLRLVLEYISPYEEPWIFAKRKYPSLQYDRYTDTGYFGIVTNTIDRFNVYTALGIDKGTRINLDFGYLAFWNHGKRILVNRASIAYGIEFNYLVNLGIVYGPDVKLNGYTNRKVTTLGDNLTYNVRLLRGGPSYMDLGPIEDLPNDKLVANANLFRYSEWNELVYRVANHIPLSVDINNFHGGFQIGKNWDTLDNINIGVFEHYSGNGCHDFVLSTVNDNEVVSRGGTKLESVYYVDKSVARNDHGVRLVLEDTTNFSI